MSRYVAKLCADKERLIRISRERITQLETELAETKAQLTKMTEDFTKADKKVK